MKRIVRILGLAMVITALLVVSIAGTVFAGNGNGPNGYGDGTGEGPTGGEGPHYETAPNGPNGPNGAGNSYGEPARNGKAWID